MAIRAIASPKTAIYADTRAKMMKRQVLEEFVKFLAPLKLPKTIWVYVDECDGGDSARPILPTIARW